MTETQKDLEQEKGREAGGDDLTDEQLEEVSGGRQTFENSISAKVVQQIGNIVSSASK